MKRMRRSVAHVGKIAPGYLRYLRKEAGSLFEFYKVATENGMLNTAGMLERNKTTRKAYMLHMAEKEGKVFPLMVEITDAKFLVSAMPEGKDDFASYVEVLVSEEDGELYNYLLNKVGALNIAGINQEIASIGEKYDDTIFALYADEKIHQQIITGSST